MARLITCYPLNVGDSSCHCVPTVNVLPHYYRRQQLSLWPDCERVTIRLQETAAVTVARLLTCYPMITGDSSCHCGPTINVLPHDYRRQQLSLWPDCERVTIRLQETAAVTVARLLTCYHTITGDSSCHCGPTVNV